MTDPQPNPPQDETAASPRKGAYWKTLFAIPPLAVGILAVLWRYADEDSSLQMMFVLGVVSGTALCLVLWWSFLSGVTRRTRLIGLGAAAAAVGMFFAAFQPIGFTGDFIPQFAPRWQPTPEQRVASFLRASPKPTSPVAIEKVEDGDWPGFRGPNRDGIARSVSLRRDWDANPPKELWRHPVGPAWSAFAIVDRLAFTQEQRDADEAVVCYDRDSGAQNWAHTDKARFSEAMGGDGPRATPTYFDGRLYALGATGILNCLDPLTGSVHWSRNILTDAGLNPEADNLKWAMAGSPLVYRDVVVVNPGGTKGNSVIAYDLTSGEPRWAGGSRRAGYSSPLAATLGGVEQILVFGGDGLSGHDANDGSELWFQEWTTQQGINAIQPIVLPDKTIFLSSGYNVGSGLFEVQKNNNAWQVKEHAWGKRKNKFKLKFNDGVYKDGFIYGLDEGILACFDVKSGEITWKKGRYKYGQILLVGDLLLINSEAGRVVLVEADPKEFRELAGFQALTGKTWNHAALAHNRLLVRNAEEAACYNVE